MTVLCRICKGHPDVPWDDSLRWYHERGQMLGAYVAGARLVGAMVWDVLYGDGMVIHFETFGRFRWQDLLSGLRRGVSKAAETGGEVWTFVDPQNRKLLRVLARLGFVGVGCFQREETPMLILRLARRGII